MKKTILITLLLAFTVSTFAQKNKRAERIKALKVAFITEHLDLTPKEAQLFWPVYNASEDEKNALRKETQNIRKDVNFESLTDNQANKLVQTMLEFEDRKHQLHKKQVTNLLKVIPAKKVIKLRIAEEKFNRRMLQEIKNRRQKFQNKNRP
jgi:hypothetical protein